MKKLSQINLILCLASFVSFNVSWDEAKGKNKQQVKQDLYFVINQYKS